jgi:hypothetical protein
VVNDTLNTSLKLALAERQFLTLVLNVSGNSDEHSGKNTKKS